MYFGKHDRFLQIYYLWFKILSLTSKLNSCHFSSCISEFQLLIFNFSKFVIYFAMWYELGIFSSSSWLAFLLNKNFFINHLIWYLCHILNFNIYVIVSWSSDYYIISFFLVCYRIFKLLKFKYNRLIFKLLYCIIYINIYFLLVLFLWCWWLSHSAVMPWTVTCQASLSRIFPR